MNVISGLILVSAFAAESSGANNLRKFRNFATMSILCLFGSILVISYVVFSNISSTNRIAPANQDGEIHLTAVNFGGPNFKKNFRRAEKLSCAAILVDIVLQVLSVNFSWRYAYGYCQYWWDYTTPALHFC